MVMEQIYPEPSMVPHGEIKGEVNVDSSDAEGILTVWTDNVETVILPIE